MAHNCGAEDTIGCVCGMCEKPADTVPDDMLREQIWKKLEWYFGGERQNMRLASKDITSLIRTAIQSAVPEKDEHLAHDLENASWNEMRSQAYLEGYHAAIDTFCKNLTEKGLL